MEFNNIYSGLISGKEKLALVGLGYVYAYCCGICKACKSNRV